MADKGIRARQGMYRAAGSAPRAPEVDMRDYATSAEDRERARADAADASGNVAEQRDAERIRREQSGVRVSPADVAYGEPADLSVKGPFVRLLHHVGRFPAGSVVPASTFEQLDRLLGLGSVVYDDDATESSIMLEGSPAPTLIESVRSGTAPTLPHAPWVAASPEEVLGAMGWEPDEAPAVRVWTADAPHGQAVGGGRQYPRHASDQPVAAINEPDHGEEVVVPAPVRNPTAAEAAEADRPAPTQRS